MKELDVSQGTLPWLQARLGIVTASELDALLTPSLEPRKGQGVETYLARKLAERWTRTVPQPYHGGAMEQGSILEDEARPWLEDHLGCDIRRPGFIMADDGSMGCSPDGLGDGFGVEIKCPEQHTHVKWLLAGGVPPEHAAQVFGSMFVTGLERWYFVSYCRGLPPLVFEAGPMDNEWVETVRRTLESFNARLDYAYRRLVELNGGVEPVHRVEQADDAFIF